MKKHKKDFGDLVDIKDSGTTIATVGKVMWEVNPFSFKNSFWNKLRIKIILFIESWFKRNK